MKERLDSDDSVHLPPELEQELRALAHRGRQPRRDLWSGVHEKISTRPVASTLPDAGRQATRWPSARLGWAAAILISIVSAAVLWALLDANTRRLPQLVESQPMERLPQESPAELRALLRDHLDERRQLLEGVSTALRSHPPAVARDVRSNLQILESAMQELETSIARLPTNDEERLALATLYQRELNLLRQLNDRLRGASAELRTE